MQNQISRSIPLVVRHALVMVFAAVLACLAAYGIGASGQEERAPETTIAAKSDPLLDRQIERRLGNIFSTLEGLDGIEVEVDEGIVTLRGEVYERDTEQRALELAARTAGVVSVQNELSYDQDVTRKLDIAWNKLAARGLAVVQFLPVLLASLLIFGLFWLLARWLTQNRGLFDRLAPNVFIGDLIRQLVRIAITLGGLIIALEVADASAILGSVLGAMGLVGLAVGFAIRDTVENYIASILLSLRQPFAPNDHVIIQDQEGLVLRLTSRATLLMTFDGNHIRIPNSAVYKGVITNFSRNPQRRFSFTLGVGTEVNLIDALRLARETMLDSPGVLAKPAPLGQIDSLGDSNVLLRFYAWLDQGQSNYSTVRSETIRRVKAAYEIAGFDMPEPIFRVQLQGVAPAQLVSPDVGSDLPEARSRGSDEPVEHEPLTGDDSPEEAVLAQARADASLPAGEDNLLNEDAPRE